MSQQFERFIGGEIDESKNWSERNFRRKKWSLERGRFLVDVPGQMERQKRSVVLGMEMLKAHLNGRTEGVVLQSRRKTPLVNCFVLNKHLHPLRRKLGLERGGMPGFRHHGVSTLVMAGTPMVVIKNGLGMVANSPSS